MENLSPSLILLWDVRRSVENGRSVGQGVKVFLARELEDAFSGLIESWWKAQGRSNVRWKLEVHGSHRRMLIELLEAGLRGQSISQPLRSLELEMVQSCEDEIAAHVASLPLLLMFPLLGLIFPSMLVLLLVPILKMLQF